MYKVFNVDHSKGEFMIFEEWNKYSFKANYIFLVAFFFKFILVALIFTNLNLM